MARSFVCESPRTLHSGEAVRCWKCSGCRTLTSWIKSLKVHLEALGHDDRVWLCTLTFKEEPRDERSGYTEVQKWLKRVRFALDAKDGSKLRYTCVYERGSVNNRGHYHLVVYSGQSLKWRALDCWSCGYSQFKLVNGTKAANYVLKYLSKGHGKVRSSIKLGHSLMDKAHDAAQSILSEFPGARIVRIGPAKVPREYQRPTSYQFTPKHVLDDLWGPSTPVSTPTEEAIKAQARWKWLLKNQPKRPFVPRDNWDVDYEEADDHGDR